MAENPLGGGLILKYRSAWAPAAETFPGLIFVLVLLLARNKGQLQFLESDSAFPRLLRSLAATGDREVIAGIPKLLAPMRLNKSFAYAAGDCRLFPVLAVAVGTDELLRRWWFEFAGKLAPIAFVSDLVLCERFMIALLDEEALVAVVLGFIASLCAIPEYAAALKKSGVAKKVAGKKFTGELSAIAKTITVALK
jgi:hypothetical protein